MRPFLPPALLHAAVTAALLFAACCRGALAQTDDTPQALPPPLRLTMPAAAARTSTLGLARGQGAAASPAERLPAFSIVALPPEGIVGGGARQRAHHALSLRSDTALRGLRSLGVDASDCAVQLRAPTRLTHANGGGPSTLDFQAQVRLACRM